MSVLIKDMKKPTCCYEVINGDIEYCPFVDGDSNCVLLLKNGIRNESWEDQYSKCPMNEAPEYDAISRQAAIDAFDDTTYTKNEIRRRITELSPVTPAKLLAKISFDDKKLKEIADEVAEVIIGELLITDFSGNDRTITAAKAAPSIPTTPPVYAVSADDVIENMESELELCNRVLDELDIVGTEREIHSRIAEMLREQIDFVKELPQVEPEPRKGEWILDANNRCHCSKCNYYRQLQIPEPDNYCPKCGAKMGGEAKKRDTK